MASLSCLACKPGALCGYFLLVLAFVLYVLFFYLCFLSSQAFVFCVEVSSVQLASLGANLFGFCLRRLYLSL